MSNRRKIKKERDATVSAIAAASRCSDCPGRATKKWRRGQWHVDMHHMASCPALRGLTSLDSDAAQSVSRAAAALSADLRYQADGPGGWVVSGAPDMTPAGRRGRRSS